MPATCLNNSAARCCVAPKPGLPNTILPGLALAAATSDLMSLYGESGRTTIEQARGRDLADPVERARPRRSASFLVITEAMIWPAVWTPSV